MKKNSALRQCVKRPREAKLGKLSFWQQLNKTRQNNKLTCQAISLAEGIWLWKLSMLLLKDFLLKWWKRCSICFCVRVMLSKGNRMPRWRVGLRANGRPRQIKSNGHLSCWQLKSHLSNYSWCLALRSKQSFQQRNKWCGAREHGLLQRSMNFIRKQVKPKNNKQLFHVQQCICCMWWISAVAGHLSLGHWRQDGIRDGDNRCTGERTIPLHCVLPVGRPTTCHALKPHPSYIMRV